MVTKIGGVGGFSARMTLIPDADTGIVILTNVDTMGLPMTRNVQYRLVEMLYGLEPKLGEFIEAELGQIWVLVRVFPTAAYRSRLSCPLFGENTIPRRPPLHH